MHVLWNFGFLTYFPAIKWLMCDSHTALSHPQENQNLCNINHVALTSSLYATFHLVRPHFVSNSIKCLQAKLEMWEMMIYLRITWNRLTLSYLAKPSQGHFHRMSIGCIASMYHIFWHVRSYNIKSLRIGL
jgi:hypothetical protein